MGFTEALHKSAEGYAVLSRTNTLYLPEELNAEKLGSHAATCRAIVPEYERRGKWRLYDE